MPERETEDGFNPWGNGPVPVMPRQPEPNDTEGE
jgi:hypothetical protein